MPTIPIPPLEENSPEQHAYFDAIKKRMELDDVPLVTRAMVYKLDTAIAHAKGMGVLMEATGYSRAGSRKCWLSPHQRCTRATTEWSRILLPGCSRVRKQRTPQSGSKQTLSSWPCTA